jgi:hypothetical protein
VDRIEEFASRRPGTLRHAVRQPDQVPKTTFATEAILERQHLQAAVRDRIEVLGDDLLVVVEEFGEFEDTAGLPSPDSSD